MVTTEDLSLTLETSVVYIYNGSTKSPICPRVSIGSFGIMDSWTRPSLVHYSKDSRTRLSLVHYSNSVHCVPHCVPHRASGWATVPASQYSYCDCTVWRIVTYIQLSPFAWLVHARPR